MKFSTTRWMKHAFPAGITVGIDDTAHYGTVTPEQALAFVNGTLDYCDGCMSLQPAFEGDDCPACAALSVPTDEQLHTLLGRWGAKPIDAGGLIADLRQLFQQGGKS